MKHSLSTLALNKEISLVYYFTCSQEGIKAKRKEKGQSGVTVPKNLFCYVNILYLCLIVLNRPEYVVVKFSQILL